MRNDRNKPSKSAGSVTLVKSKSSTGATYLKPIVKVRSVKEIEEFKRDLTLDEHMINLDELVIRYCTDIYSGLNKAKADELLKTNGPNCLVASATKSRWIILAEFLFGGFNMLLWAGTILTFIGYGMNYSQAPTETPKDSLYLAIVLVSVILFTGFFGFYQESTSNAIMESFKKLIPKFATVIRSGDKYVIPSEEIVLGDLVEVRSGDIVPADIRLVEAQNLKVDNSAITGESHPLSRSSECTDIDPLETMNLAFYSTSVLQGFGTGIVIKCGDDTVIGRIAGLTSSIEKTETLIHKELNHFVKVITYLAVAIGVAFFIVSLIMGYGFFKSFTFFIAIVIANVPEGLPVCLTACMSLAAKRMAQKNCLVKKLECIETLGACNVICSDKTGTLTQNQMTVSHLFYDATERSVLTNFESVDRDNDSYVALCNIAILCSRASFVDGPDVPIERRRASGDASESAILKIMERLEGNVEEKRKRFPKCVSIVLHNLNWLQVCEIPFNSKNKYQVSIHRLEIDRFLLVMKGAPERVLDRCDTILRDGEVIENNVGHQKSIKKAIVNLGRKGERLLAFADLLLPASFHADFEFDVDRPNFPLKGLRFVGMVSMIDPPRPLVPEAVSKCRSAGIRVIMVTGDHPVTAAAIAKKVGILSINALSVYDIALQNEVSLSTVTAKEKMECTAAVVTGADLREMQDRQLEGVLRIYKEIVFARTSPQQKLKIVEALQRLNLVVAVTGDGVNDSPALKKADIGIAMGITGSDVSKEAADMILLDDNFNSIVTGIEEGRLIFDNLKKSIAYVLTSNVPEIVPFMLLMALNIPEALSIMAIIVIDVGTDLWPAISLAYEKAESDIMKRKPRNPKKDKLINKRLIFLTYAQIGLIQTCASFVTYFYLMAGHGFFSDRLIGIRKEWENKHINDIQDSYGQEWTFEQRQILEKKCITGYFLSIVITQISDLLVCKTRRLSLFQQGITNHVMNAGVMFEIFLAGIVVFCPGINVVFQFEPIDLLALIPTLPFAAFIIIYDEIRKLIIRKFPHGVVYHETYY